MTTDADERALLAQIKALQRKAKEKKKQANLPPKPKNADVMKETMQYLYYLKGQSRVQLLQIYFDLFDKEAPDTNRDWYINQCIRKYQKNCYAKHGIPYPESCKETDAKCDAKPIPPRDEPSWVYGDKTDDGSIPDYLRLVAVKPNEFRGNKWTTFQIIHLAGEKGISYKNLVKKINHVVELKKRTPEQVATRAFKRWVQEGLCKTILYKGEEK